MNVQNIESVLHVFSIFFHCTYNCVKVEWVRFITLHVLIRFNTSVCRVLFHDLLLTLRLCIVGVKYVQPVRMI